MTGIELELADLLLPARGLTRSAPVGLRQLPPVENVRIVDQYLFFKTKEPDRITRDGVGIYDAGFASTRDELDARALSRCQQDMLGRFTELHGRPDSDILEYAKYWGPLRICQHNLPHQHPALSGSVAYRLTIPPPLPRKLQEMLRREKQRSKEKFPDCAVLNLEPLATWRFFSRQARAIIDIAARIRTKKLGTDADWELVLRNGLPKPQPRVPSKVLELHSIFLVEAIRGWMSLSTFKPWLLGLDGKISLSGADLIAKLSVEIALAASGCKGAYVCSACGRQYETSRKPAKGRENYCGRPECLREGARRRKERARFDKSRRELPSGHPVIQMGSGAKVL